MGKNKGKKQSSGRPHKWLRFLSWTGSVVSNGLAATLVGYLSFYLTDSVFLGAGVAAGILAASRIFDGISDIIAGYIIDHTRTRWGKARPYTIFEIFRWIAVIFLFSVPDISTTGKIIYVFLIYNLTDTVFRTMLSSSTPVHFKNGFTNDEQITLTGVSGFLAGIMTLAVTIILPILVDNYGTTPEGWRMIAIALAIPGMILGLLKLFFVPEADAEEIYSSKQEKVSLKESIKSLFTNKYIVMIMFPYALVCMYQGLGINTYYFKYIVGNISAASLVGMAGLLTMVVMPFLPMLANKLGMKKTITISFLLAGIGAAIPYLAPANMVLICIASAFMSIGTVPIAMYGLVLGAQCMKYTEWKDGKAIDGLIGAVNGLAEKVGRALGAVITGFMLGLTGYNGALEMQNGSTTTMIKFLYLGFPCLVMLIGALVIRKYDLEEKMPQIEKDLEERKAKHTQV